MTHFQTLKNNAQLVMTYLLTLVDGTQYTLMPVDGYGSAMEQAEGSDIWHGHLLQGGTIEVPDAHVLMIEEDRYRVTIKTNQGVKGFNISEREVNKQITERAKRDETTGEVDTGSWRTLKDRKTGETIEFE